MQDAKHSERAPVRQQRGLMMTGHFSRSLFILPFLFSSVTAYSENTTQPERTLWIENHLNTSLAENLENGANPSNSPSNRTEDPRKKDFAPWSAQPLCNGAWGNIHTCEFNHKNGHGLLILQQKSVNSFPNYLVCASMTGQTNNWFDNTEIVTSNCLVSSVDWRSNPGRSDARGVLSWLQEPASYKTLSVPASLAEHCKGLFAEASYCSPTLLVLPSENPHAFDVCWLKTFRSETRLVVLDVNTYNSEWHCERKDLRFVDTQERLGANAWRCVANDWGYVNPKCPLPYIPTTQRIRVNRDDRPTPVLYEPFKERR
jgi:hypothetical protein